MALVQAMAAEEIVYCKGFVSKEDYRASDTQLVREIDSDT
jgi:hypothetical protein